MKNTLECLHIYIHILLKTYIHIHLHQIKQLKCKLLKHFFDFFI